ncbi:ABC transporter permease [Agrococcus jejuensis]|uniref:Transport permease protein n=1 Tax=Agrococcus jejuensis TaxID=399736 RepID=A0A1G8FHY3_9MICO|nr:ABC transporter permease [Agrococcus jejuensis]SDH81733.1 ABC-2 type transport system permease protein [Agrococcus jejuensis]
MTSTRQERAAERAVTLNLLKNLTLREIRSQYKRTALGRIWSLINPLAQIAIFSLVFGFLFQIPAPVGTNSGLEIFPVWIGIGVITWGFVSGAISAGMGSLVDNAGLLTKVYFPRSVLVTSTILSSAFTYATELLVLVAVVVSVGGPQVLLYVLLLVPLLALTVCFVLGIALLLSVASVYFRDLRHLWGIFTQVWMYGSGVMFPVALVRQAEERIATEQGLSIPLVTIFEANPAERFLSAYRNVLYDFQVPPLDTWITIILWAAIALVGGMLVFRRLARDIVEEI